MASERTFPRAAAGSVALGALAVRDAVLPGADPASDTMFGLTTLAAVGLGAFVGAVTGLGWDILARLRARWSAAIVVVPLLSLALATWLMRGLGAFARLGGKDHALAVAALVAATALAIGSAVAGKLLLDDKPPASRWLVVAALVGTVACGVADRVLFVGLHPVAHTALRVAQWWSLALVVLWIWRGSPWPERARVGMALALLTTGIVLGATLDTGRSAALVSRPSSALSLSLARFAVDLDRDGFAGAFGGTDCDEFDARVNPGMAEIPGNDVDDNCLAGDATPGLVLPVDEVPIPSTPAPIDVLFFTFDTVRPDHTGAYGYARDTTPNLRRLAEDARVFYRAYAPGPGTILSLPSMMRGVWARRLEYTGIAANGRFGLVTGAGSGNDVTGIMAVPVDDPRPTLAAWLQRRGMWTGAVVADGTTNYFAPAVGAADGFDRFVHAGPDLGGKHGDDAIADAAIELLGGAPDDPAFVWVHLFGPHGPNTHHPGTPTFGDDRIGGYDHEIAFADAQFGRVLEVAERRSARNGRALAVIAASDHGETFESDGRYHGHNFAETNLKVVLVIRAPGMAPGRDDRLASLIDILPTVFALTETPPPPDLDGIDLGSADTHPFLRADLWYYRDRVAPWVDVTTVFDGTYKAIFDRAQDAAWIELQDGRAAKNTPVPPQNRVLLQGALTDYLEHYGDGRLAVPKNDAAGR